nr:alpha/beta fold hydrolase [Geodermatophilaceae bacterium]
DLVDIGDRSLFFHCEGSTGPTVLLEAGLTGDHRTWESVIPGLPADTRVCAYDRANIAPSDLASKPRTAQDAVDDLEALLDAAEEPAPYVMVGFSFGGIITQLYAAEHPDDIAALVLVESNHPDEADLFAAHLTPDQIAADHAEADANPEGIDIFGSFEQVQAAGPLPQVPLVVVTATESIEWPPGWDAALFGQLRGQLQADLATLVPGGTQVFADGSGHHVPQERPAVVIDAITSVLRGE